MYICKVLQLYTCISGSLINTFAKQCACVYIFLSVVKQKNSDFVSFIWQTVTARKRIAAFLLVLWLYCWYSQVRFEHLLDYWYTSSEKSRIDRFDEALDRQTQYRPPTFLQRLRRRIRYHLKGPRRSRCTAVVPLTEDEVRRQRPDSESVLANLLTSFGRRMRSLFKRREPELTDDDFPSFSGSIGTPRYTLEELQRQSAAHAARVPWKPEPDTHDFNGDARYRDRVRRERLHEQERADECPVLREGDEDKRHSTYHIVPFVHTLVPYAPNGQHVVRADHRFEDESDLPQRNDPGSPVCRE